MTSPMLIFFIAIFVAYGYDLTSSEQICPPPSQVTPCKCFKDSISARVTALCKNFTQAADLSDVFTKNPRWNLQDVHVDNCTMSYIPAVMLETARFQSLNISSSTLNTLFDVQPKKTPELNLYLYSLKLLRGFEWSLFSNSSLKEFGAFDTHIYSFGSTFKESMPRETQRIWFENTRTRRITAQAFMNLKNLQTLTIRRAQLKTVSRDMFPNPWNSLVYLDFSFNQISSLPEDMFSEMPKIAVFMFEGNKLTTLSEKTFVKSTLLYGLVGNPLNCNCEMKWVTIPGKITPILFKANCAEPDTLRGKEVAELTKENFNFCT